MLTSRTHFFKENKLIHKNLQKTSLYDSINNKFGYQLLFINELSNYQIENYVLTWFSNDSENGIKYLELIEKIYNLSDLATRPALLNMIVQTLPQINFKSMNDIDSSVLYDLYINFWFNRDEWRRIINKEDSRKIVCVICEYLLVSATNSIPYYKIPEIISNFDNKLKQYSIDIIDNELRTCNFMKRDASGNYEMMHKSFMDYFLADIMLEAIFENTKDIDKKWFLPIETVDSLNSGKNVSTIESQWFLTKKLNNRLLSLTHLEIYKLIRDRQRIQKLVLGLIDDTYKELNLLLRLLPW